MTKKRPSNRRRSNNIATPDWIVGPKMQRKQGILWYTIGIIIAAAAFHFVEWIARKGDIGDTNSLWFAGVNLYYLWHGLAFMIYLPFMKDIPIPLGIVPKIEIVNIADFGAGNMIKQFIIGFGLCIAAEVTFGVILRPVLGIVSGAELVFFFVFGAVMEEILYRFLIQNIIAGLLGSIIPMVGGKRFKKKNGIGEYWLPGILAVLIASVIFMLAHLGVYGATLSSLFGTFGLGLAFGMTYLISNNIFIPILLHMSINGFTKGFQIASGMASTNGELLIASITIIVLMIFSVIVKKHDKSINCQNTTCGFHGTTECEGLSHDSIKKSTRWWVWLLLVIGMALVTIFTLPGWIAVPDSLDLPSFDPIFLIMVVFGILFTIIIIIESIKLIDIYRRRKPLVS
jgi:membrane protease YdiL (CAAX protease family)